MKQDARFQTIGLALCFCLDTFFLATPAAAQAFRHPFSVGAQEGAVGSVSGLSAWIIGQESRFYLLLEHGLASARHSALALAGLIALGFAYGVFHAAGPGHGKAVITSYMVSNERALRRGIVISFLAALLQGLVAIVAIGCAALIFNATAQRMTATAHALELAAYCGIILLGVMLVVRKGSSLLRSIRAALAQSAPRWRRQPAELAATGSVDTAMAPAVLSAFANVPQRGDVQRQSSLFRATSAVDATDHGEDCGPQCGHVLALDPRQLGDSFSLKSAALTIVTAGARPCAGAILVLVFSLAQGIFPIGVATVIAIALGTAVTTSGLAIIAVFGKKLAVRLAGRRQSLWARLVAQAIEVGAALCVLVFGLVLFYASWMGVLTPR
ncbi:MAG: nickel/cobalt transporter [Beijerinckiaceae bacterium]|nr:MAG: nickel/cobalt transporter [Beijerinckiaceae bacterium]